MVELPANYNTLTRSQRKEAREQYIQIQNGNCFYCNEPLTRPPSEKIAGKEVDKRNFPPAFFNYPIHLHHSHDTGMTIGAVHCYCNAVLWQYDGE